MLVIVLLCVFGRIFHDFGDVCKWLCGVLMFVDDFGVFRSLLGLIELTSLSILPRLSRTHIRIRCICCCCCRGGAGVLYIICL